MIINEKTAYLLASLTVTGRVISCLLEQVEIKIKQRFRKNLSKGQFFFSEKTPETSFISKSSFKKLNILFEHINRSWNQIIRLSKYISWYVSHICIYTRAYFLRLSNFYFVWTPSKVKVNKMGIL